tara:strand:- start:68814 stop:69017 length:204 start_codon:yes stop_codon:yes gene_type:complete
MPKTLATLMGQALPKTLATLMEQALPKTLATLMGRALPVKAGVHLLTAGYWLKNCQNNRHKIKTYHS